MSLCGITLAAVAASAGLAAGPATAREPVDSIAEIRRLSAVGGATRVPVCVRGVVTFKEDWLVIQDGDDSIAATYGYTDADQAAIAAGQPPRCSLGSTVEIEGITRLKNFAPHIDSTGIREIAAGELPDPEPADLGALWAGELQDRRVVVEGVAQSVYVGYDGRDWTLTADVAGHRLLVDVSRRMWPERPDDLVDAEIRVAGVVGCIADASDRFIAPRIRICRRDDIAVLAPAPAQPFAQPLTPLAAVNLFRAAPLRGRRLRTGGIVTFVAPDRIFLQDHGLGMQVGLASGGRAAGDAVAPGDRVDVVAFRDLAGRSGLAEGIVRKIAAGSPPEPLVIQLAEIDRFSRMRAGRMAWGSSDVWYSSDSPAPDHNGCLIRCRGRIEKVHGLRDETVVALSSDGFSFDARLPGKLAPADAARLAPGSEVEVTGIVEVHLAPRLSGDVIRNRANPDRVGLIVRAADDIVVTRPPSWWTPRRLAIFAGCLAAAAAAAGGWAVFLRREVARQTARAVAEATARRQAAIEYEAALRERTRIAGDLHDTLLQTMTGIGYRLQSGQAWIEQLDAHAAGNVRTAERLVRQVARQLRGTVWALRSLPDVSQPFDAPVRGLLQHLTAGHDVTHAVHLSGTPAVIDETVARQLLFVIQEAVLNALQHGRARHLEVTLEFEPNHEGLCLRIEDDGTGFVADARPGPDAGHFGIQGMRERLDRLGGWLEIVSTTGRGTTVCLRVPRPLLGVEERDRLLLETGATP